MNELSHAEEAYLRGTPECRTCWHREPLHWYDEIDRWGCLVPMCECEHFIDASKPLRPPQPERELTELEKQLAAKIEKDAHSYVAYLAWMQRSPKKEAQ